MSSHNIVKDIVKCPRDVSIKRIDMVFREDGNLLSFRMVNSNNFIKVRNKVTEQFQYLMKHDFDQMVLALQKHQMEELLSKSDG